MARGTTPQHAASGADAADGEPAGSGAPATPPTDGGAPSLQSARIAWWVFLAFVVVALPLILFGLGAYHWFFRDDFFFITERQSLSMDTLFRPHNAHWSTVPVVAFMALWKLFGLRSYVPYQAVVVVLHLSVAVLLRQVMRRAEVTPWLATAAAAVFVLFGPGSENITWAFQIGYTGSVAFGLAQLLLADHDGPIGRRDALALGAGVLALMCSGVGVTMVAVVGLAILLRRGWLAAFLQTAPLAAAYGLYYLIESPQIESVFGRPPLGTVVSWVKSGQIGTFLAVGHFQLVAAALALVLVGGLVLACIPSPWRALRGRLAGPIAMLAGSVLFGIITAQGRWYLGAEGARSSRYLYIGAALTLPALAVAADAIGRRWRVAIPALAVLFLVAVPFNLGQFDEPPFGSNYFAIEKRVLTTAVRMPFADEVPPDVRPIPDVYLSPGLNIGFLLEAKVNGKLRPSTGEISAEEENEFRVRLGVALRDEDIADLDCRKVDGQIDLSPAKGTVLGFKEPVRITTLDGSEPSSPTVVFNPTNGGHRATIELDDLHLRVKPAGGATSFTLCQ